MCMASFGTCGVQLYNGSDSVLEEGIQYLWGVLWNVRKKKMTMEGFLTVCVCGGGGGGGEDLEGEGGLASLGT